MSINKTNENNANTSMASVAASNIKGYLKNASKRHRIPAAEGGRGTRRKLTMVTSVSEDTAANVSFNIDDEWDVVELPVFSIKKQDPVKVDHEVMDDALKLETALPILKDNDAGTTTVASTVTAMSSSLAKIETFGDVEPTHSVNESDFVIQGARLPLIEQPRGSLRLRRDPAYEAMMEQRDLLASRRKSERIQLTSIEIVKLMSVMERGRLLWREAHHKLLVKILLLARLDATEDTRTEPHARIPFSPTAAHITPPTKKRFPFLAAVQRAREAALEAVTVVTDLHRPSLVPTWVTLHKDTAKNATSKAVGFLLEVINTGFELTPQEETVSAGKMRSLDAKNAGEANSSAPQFSDWGAPLAAGFLYTNLRQRICKGGRPNARRISLPHPVYFSIIFLALAAAAGLRCRLVVAKQAEKVAESNEAHVAQSPSPISSLEKISIFLKPPKKRALRKDSESTTRGEVLLKKLPTSCFWVEVWSPERECFIAVNPCARCTTLWGAPYTFSIGGDVIVDATPRYISKFSSAYASNGRLGYCNQFSLLWKDKLNWDDNREISEVLLGSFCQFITPSSHAQMARERKQLMSLAYSEAIPTTLGALHRHPLFVIEQDLARHEGIYPKDASTTVGSVKGHLVYKRSAIVNLRSRDGWLREGRSLQDEKTEPYKSMPPPASRPFVAPSLFYGIWQTKLFEPTPLCADGTIPLHGRTSWYILLNAPPPNGLSHLTQPQIARVARRMQLDFRFAVTGFVRKRVDERRRGHWEAIINGIVVRECDQAKLVRAYEEWLQLVQEQEATRRRERALHWWLFLSQRLLAMYRLHNQYIAGVSHGEIPAH